MALEIQLPSENPLGLLFESIKPPYSEGNKHKGTDFSARPDPRVYKMVDGPVQLVQWDGQTTEGNMAIETAKDGDDAVRFAHCHIETFLVPNNSWHPRGTPIAIMGYTGFVKPAGEDGRHLHTTARINNVLVNLLSLITVSFGKGGEQTTMGQQLDENAVRTFLKYFVGLDKPHVNDMAFGARYRDRPVDYLVDGIINHPLFKPAFQYRDRVKELEGWLREIAGKLGVDDLNDQKAIQAALADLIKHRTDASGATPHQLASEKAVDALEAAFNTK